MAYWWCLTHSRVEGDKGCPNIERMGPYDTEEEALTAVERAHERTKAWDKADKEWADGDDT